MEATPFELFNRDCPGPVVLSVPHAGRDYGAWTAALRAPLDRLGALEDRYADALVDQAVATGVSAIVARAPRLLIDLNRAESDLDMAMVEGQRMPGGTSPRARGGLGLIPRRLTGVGEIWHEPLARAVVEERIARVHRPYHAALAGLLEAARARFGAALLLDVHSMPPLAGKDMAQIVIGNRFGFAASGWLTDTTEAVIAGAGLTTAVNTPYSGGYILVEHADPGRSVHALQIEVDRSLYLDSALDRPGPGLPAVAALIARLASVLGERLAGRGEVSLAAE